MPSKKIGWTRIAPANLPPEATNVAGVLKADPAINAFEFIPYMEWCQENLGPEGKEWGRVNQFSCELWFRYHGAVTLFLMRWHQQDAPPLKNATIRFLPDSASGVEWVKRDRSQPSNEQPKPKPGA